MQQLYPPLVIRSIFPHQDATDFFDYLDKPQWFLNQFRPAFDIRRQNFKGIIYLAVEDFRIVGSIYFEESGHISYGHEIPTFGWLKAKSVSIAQKLLNIVEQKARVLGYNELRGPINQPKTFGGWGALLKSSIASDNTPLPDPLIECAENPLELASWIESNNYTRDTEYINLINTNLLEVPDFPEVELTSPPIDHILRNQELLQQIGTLVHTNFGSYLPDVSPPERAIEVLLMLKQVTHPEEFYLLAWSKSTKKLVGYILELPNLFQLWAGNAITMSDTNSVILAKEYRGLNFFHYLYNTLTARMHARGITHREGTLIWVENKSALMAFTKIGYEYRRFVVFKKKLF